MHTYKRDSIVYYLYNKQLIDRWLNYNIIVITI